MKRQIMPILYDLKRSLVRPSTITLLVVFTLLGTGISYSLANLYKQINPTIGVFIYGNIEQTQCYLNGVVVDTNGELVDKFELIIEDIRYYGGRGSYSREEVARFELNGNLTLNGSEACRILGVLTNTSRSGLNGYNIGRSETTWRVVSVRVGDKVARGHTMELYPSMTGVSLWISGGFVGLNKVFMSLVVEGSSPYVQSTVLHVGSFTVKKGVVKLIVYHPINLALNTSTLRVEYSLIRDTSNAVEGIDYDKFNYTYLGSVDKGSIKIFTIHTDRSSAIAVKITDSQLSYYGTILVGSPVESSYLAYMTSTSGVGLYYTFIPILFLYIAYVFVARPRTTGSLEFLLARPVTRKDIYLNRFIAGVLLAFAATGLFLLSLSLSSRVFIGYSLDLRGFTIVYLGLTASLVSMYSLFYFIATSLRGGAYLGVSIILYLILYMFWDLIVMIALYSTGVFSRDITEAYKLIYITYYFNPAGVYDFANVYLLKHYDISLVPANAGMNIDVNTIETVINPVAVVMQPIIFTSAFLLAGYVIFRRANLSQ